MQDLRVYLVRIHAPGARVDTVLLNGAPAPWRSRSHHRSDAAAATRLSELSQREREVLLLVEGCANREIAERLFISEATVKTHVIAVLTEAPAA